MFAHMFVFVSVFCVCVRRIFGCLSPFMSAAVILHTDVAKCLLIPFIIIPTLCSFFLYLPSSIPSSLAPLDSFPHSLISPSAFSSPSYPHLILPSTRVFLLSYPLVYLPSYLLHLSSASPFRRGNYYCRLGQIAVSRSSLSPSFLFSSPFPLTASSGLPSLCDFLFYYVTVFIFSSFFSPLSVLIFLSYFFPTS